MADINKLQEGDILLVYGGRSLLARSIIAFMIIYKRKLGLITRKNYHHAATIVKVNDELRVGEAVAKGYQVVPLLHAYTPDEWVNRVDIIRSVPEYSRSERKLSSMLAVDYSLEITRYDIFALLYQIKKVIKGYWSGPEGLQAENRFYCSEAAATIANKVRPGTFDDPAATNPIDIAINKNFRYID